MTTKFCVLFVLAVLALQNSTATITIDLPEGVTTFSAKIQELLAKHNTQPLFEELKKEVDALLAQSDKDERLCSPKAQEFIADLVKSSQKDVKVCVNRTEVVAKDIQDKMAVIAEEATAFSKLLGEKIEECAKQPSKRTGGLIDIDTNLVSLNDLTNTFLRHIESENINKHVVLRIIQGEQQVVAGMKYILLLEVAPTDCPKTVAEPCELQTDKSQICKVEYYQRPWESKYANIISNNCTYSQEFNAESTQQLTKINTKKVETCPGCPIDIEPNLEFLKELTDTALNHIESENDYRHVILRIIRAQAQVVAGIKYILLLEVAPTNCSKTVAEPELDSCELQTDKSRVCEVSYYQEPWVSNSSNIISNNCTHSQEFDAETSQELVKINTKKGEICAGCPIDIDPNLESLKELTDTALNHIESENDYKYVILRIIRAQSQVVAGVKYILLLEVAPTDCPKTVAEPELDSCELQTDKSRVCEVSYFQEPWISNSSNIISNNCTHSQEFNAESTQELIKINTKKGEICAGCPIDIEPNLEFLKELTDTALNHIESENDYKYVILRIIRAQSQVVAGIKYILLLEVAPTDCPKTVAEPELDSCELQTDKSKVCEVSYFQEPWVSNSSNIISNNCTQSQEFDAETTQELVKINTKKGEICAGCPIDIDPNLESLKELTDTALNHIESENDYKYVVLRIIRAQSQVVAGIKYILLLEVAPTDCPKTVAEPELDSCELQTDKSRVCKVSYFQEPWVSNSSNIISNNCTQSQEFDAETTQELVKINTKKVETRDGGLIDIEPNLESLKELTDTALNHIESENDYRHVVLRIIRAQEQVVAGFKYILLLEVAPTDCLKTVAEPELNSCELQTDKSRVCEVSYYEEPWVSKYANIISNNCTYSQEFNAESSQQLAKINTKKGQICAGCPIDIEPNLESLKELTDTALNHIESENDYRHVVLRIIRAQSQVVAGVKYILLLEVAPTDCSKTVAEPEINSCELQADKSRVCEVTYYQKPWVSEYANIISNNCTNTQEFNVESVNNEKNQRNIFGFVDCVEDNTKDLQEKLEDLDLQMIQMSYLALQNGKEALKELDVCLAKAENKVTLDGRAIISGVNQCIRNADLLF